MASLKNRLKFARDALGKKDYESAKDASAQILETDPNNYNAQVFYALALLELGQEGQSEQAYRKAIVSSPDQLLAWQGIAKLYDRTEQWDKSAETLLQLMQLYAKSITIHVGSDDATKCAEALQKYVDMRRQRPASRLELVDALSLFLPQSSLYSTLSNLPPPNPTNPTSTSTFVTQSVIHDSLPTLEEIVSLLEQDEDETFFQEVEKWRKRLNAPSPETIRKEVGLEIFGKSRLPEYYNEILNHPNTPDQLRRETESKLFRHKERYLHALPRTGDLAQTKHRIARELDELVNGVVLLGIPDESAWSFYLEGQDLYSTEEYNFSDFQRFINLFPESALGNMLKGYFTYMTIPIMNEGNPNPEGDGEPKLADDDDDESFEIMLDAFNGLQHSILSHRILTDIYRTECDYENCIKLAESGLELIRRVESDRGKDLHLTRKAFQVALATCLVHYYPPKHHARALRILDEILSQEPDNIPCLMGRAYILQHSQRWSQAEELFSRVHNLLPQDVKEGLRAREESAWCIAQSGDPSAASLELQDVRTILDELDDREIDQARCWWRLGKCLWDMGDETREQAYQHFITSLKRSPSFAPAFTSLGIYYAEIASPPDPNRASKCFQKAFELDAREVEAARRLAEGFAEESEWDLVEVVARRTIEGEGGVSGDVDGGQKAIARFLPVNSWAWKAVGVVELNRRNYSAAIQSFQVSLRGEPEDQLSWLRLGEAYSKAGRHAAAVKALDRAHELQPNDWICLYLMGEVQSQTGQFNEAIHSFESILAEHPLESGVLLSLSSAHLDLGLNQVITGFTSRAEASFLSSIETALRAIDSSAGFRRVAWKVVADALYYLADISVFTDLVRVHNVLASVVQLLIVSPSDMLSALPVLPLDVEHVTAGIHILNFSVAAYDYRISFGFYDDRAKASAWLDLGMALQSWGNRDDMREHRRAALEQAIQCLKQAILADPANELHWVALGNMYFETNAKSAQHAYVKALEINSKNMETWANLGLLYLHCEDLELANQAFYRAQTLDPDYALAWVGQGLVATANNHDVDAENLFEHAAGLGATILEADLEYASRLFFRMAQEPAHRTTTSSSLLPAFFVLDRYCKQKPQDACALHLFGLVCERVGHYELAIQLIEQTISILEAAYEESEDPVIERHFTISNINMARLRLAIHDYAHAIESFGTALGLLGDDDIELSSILRTQCHFGLGLAHFKLGALEDAMSAFEASLEAAGDNLTIKGHVTVLLAQILWAIDTDETRESAKSYLLQCIASDPENLEAINTLVGMGILTADEGLVDAALSEILSLPLHRRHEMDPRRDVVELLVKQHLGQGDVTAALSEAQKAVFAEPASAQLRHKAASLALQAEQFNSALAILPRPTLLNDTSEGSQSLGLWSVAECLGGQDGISEAMKLVQKALVLDPANIQNWRILAFVRSKMNQVEKNTRKST